MYQLGDQVLYGIHGVCKIIDVESRKVDRKMIEYFVLQPIEQPDARYYIPTQNQAALSKLRPIITQQEISSLLKSESCQASDWIEDENQRKQYYKELIVSSDRAALLRMVHSLHVHKQEQDALGKKLHICDQNFLRDAEKLLNSEFSLVLKMSNEEVKDYLTKVMQGK